MCNPDDDEPCVSGTPSQEQIDNDHRTLAQRQHDALLAIGRNALESGELGQHNGLPTSIIIRTTLQDLESRAGVGTTGGGTLMPIKDVIRLAGHANHWLAVFDKATGQALDLFRAKRTASPAQRIMLIARDGGCTKPCCPVPAYGSQVHHALRDWADDGNTNVNELALACGPDNRLVDKDGGWTTTINARGDVEWIPPPDLDTGQTRVNYYHRPELLLRPPDEPNGNANIPQNADHSACDNRLRRSVPLCDKPFLRQRRRDGPVGADQAGRHDAAPPRGGGRGGLQQIPLVGPYGAVKPDRGVGGATAVRAGLHRVPVHLQCRIDHVDVGDVGRDQCVHQRVVGQVTPSSATTIGA